MTSSSEEIQRKNGDIGVPTSIGLLEAKKLFPLVRQPEWHSLYHALALKGRGSPILSPNPELQQPIEYRKMGHSIGELAIFNIRGFVDFHFNICVPGDSPLNGLPENVPQGFSPLSPPLDPTDFFEDAPFKGPTVIEGKSERKLQISGHSPGTIFDAVLEDAAILTIPDGVTSRDVIDVSCFRKYVAENAIGWYKFVNEVGGRYATNGDLRLVIGWDKCRSWSRVLSSNATVHIPDNTRETAGSFSRQGMTNTRGGKGVLDHTPVDSSEEGEIYQNQTLFLRTLNISVCDDIWSQLAEDFRRHSEPSTRPFSDGTPFKWDSQSIEAHPANGINVALLKLKPRARFAITQDRDWISVLEPDDIALPNCDEFLSRILKVYNVCEEDNVVFLKYKPEVLYRTSLRHNYHISLTLPFWKPTSVAVGAVGYFSREDGSFISLFDARAPRDSGALSLSPVRTKIIQSIHNQRSMKTKAFDLLSGLLSRKSGPPQQVSFPLKAGEKAAHIYTGPSRHRRFQADDLPMEWFKSNIGQIVETYGADRKITPEDLVLITGTLDTHDYAFFISDCHREGSVTFEVAVNPQIGQPWGTFLPGNNGQFTSKVSQHGGPWETVLASCLHVTPSP